MRIALIDGHTVTSMADVHAALAQQLNLPDWYGGNLDALHDCLTSLPEETDLTLLNWSSAEEELGRYAAALKRVLDDSAQENPLLHIHYIL